MSETSTNPGGSQPWTGKTIGLGILTVAVVTTFVGSSMIGGCREHLKYDCELQLRNVGIRCREYAAEHNGQFPSKWSELGQIGPDATWDRLFVCPMSGHVLGNWSQVDLWADYRLIPERSTNDPADTVLAIEPLSNHKTGANVLFVDGSSQWWPAKRVLGEKTLPSSARE